MHKVLLGCIGFIFFISGNPFLMSWLAPPLASPPVILVVGDFSGTGFGQYIERGVKEAEIFLKNNGELDVEVIKIHVKEHTEIELNQTLNYDQSAENKQLKHHLIEEISCHNVIGILSANSSQTSETVLRVGKSFNIPVLLSISSNNDIMKGYEKTAIRLLPSDAKQSKIIAEHIEELIRDSIDFRVGLIYSPTIYGLDLKNAITTINSKQIIPFTTGTTTDIAGILNYGKKMDINYWVALTYESEAQEIYAKKQAYRIQEPILYSDGSYGNWVYRIGKSQDAEIVFPDIDRAKSQNLRGYEIFGHDAIIAVNDAYRLFLKNREQSKDAFHGLLKKCLNEDVEQELLLDYEINEYGENETSEFKIYKFNNLSNTTLPNL